MCPLIDENIEAIECIENHDCVDGIIVLSSLPRKIKTKDNFIEICRNCVMVKRLNVRFAKKVIWLHHMIIKQVTILSAVTVKQC